MKTGLIKKLFLAPMAEITTPALRRTIKYFTDDVVLFSEMLSAGAVVRGAKFNNARLSTYEFDDPYVFQIIGDSPDIMAEACLILSEKKSYAIDINMGCSAPDILKKGFGAKLLTDIKKTRALVKACRKNTKTLLSVKMRTGFEKNDETYMSEFLKMLEDEGIDFISIHPRYAKLSFARSADWRLIKLAKKTISIPVIGNGDIKIPETALKNMDETGCDAVMIGREAARTPWIFKTCSELMNNGYTSFDVDACEVFLKTLDYISLYLPGELHKSRGHRFCSYYSKNVKFSHDLFTKIRRVDSIENMKTIVYDYYARNPDEKMKHIEMSKIS